MSGSKFTAFLLKRWILTIGGASAEEGLPCSLRSRLVCVQYAFHSYVHSPIYTVDGPLFNES